MDTRDERTGLEQERARVAAGRGLADDFKAAGRVLADGFRDFNGPGLLTSALVGDGRPTASSPPSRGRNNPPRGGSTRPVSVARSEWRDDDERRRQCALQP